jgi:NAD(P)-dependent dehydrogenase (short-subunit alcohol dehydrogenase family)
MGKEIAVSLAEAGFDVAVAARTLAAGEPTRDHSQSIHTVDARPLPGSLEETADLVRAQGREALPVRMDLTDRTTVDEAMDVIDRTWGTLDLVVNNGRHIGPGLMDTILDTPVDQYEKFLLAHGVNAIRIVQLALPGMLERGAGTFVTISSGAGTNWYPQGVPGHGGVGLGYRIGKAAGHTIVGSILAEYADQGIRAFNVDPGFVATERNQLDGGSLGFDPKMAAPPQLIGAVVAWLATDPGADDLLGTDLQAQPFAIERGIYPDWRN